MDMHEFSHELAREQHSSPRSELFRALRNLSDLEMNQLRDWVRIIKKWGVWTELKPDTVAERTELRS